jgi:hypothetical protein
MDYNHDEDYDNLHDLSPAQKASMSQGILPVLTPEQVSRLYPYNYMTTQELKQLPSKYTIVFEKPNQYSFLGASYCNNVYIYDADGRREKEYRSL